MMQRMNTLKFDELIKALDYIDRNPTVRPKLHLYYQEHIKFLIDCILKRCNSTNSSITPIPSTPKIFFGSSTNRKDHIYDGNSFMFDVDISHLNLKKAPFISTFMTSTTNDYIWDAIGTTSIYRLSNKRF